MNYNNLYYYIYDMIICVCVCLFIHVPNLLLVGFSDIHFRQCMCYRVCKMRVPKKKKNFLRVYIEPSGIQDY